MSRLTRRQEVGLFLSLVGVAVSACAPIVAKNEKDNHTQNEPALLSDPLEGELVTPSGEILLPPATVTGDLTLSHVTSYAEASVTPEPYVPSIDVELFGGMKLYSMDKTSNVFERGFLVGLDAVAVSILKENGAKVGIFESGELEVLVLPAGSYSILSPVADTPKALEDPKMSALHVSVGDFHEEDTLDIILFPSSEISPSPSLTQTTVIQTNIDFPVLPVGKNPYTLILVRDTGEAIFLVPGDKKGTSSLTFFFKPDNTQYTVAPASR